MKSVRAPTSGRLWDRLSRILEYIREAVPFISNNGNDGARGLVWVRQSCPGG